VASLLEKDNGQFCVVLPGPKFRIGIPEFERNMDLTGFKMEKKDIIDSFGVVEHSFYRFQWK
jgi:hypothetical protein